MQNCSMPAARASSIAYWISGLSTTGSISLAIALVAGRKRVPRPATGRTALRNGLITMCLVLPHPVGDWSAAANIADRRKCGVRATHASGTWQRVVSRWRAGRHHPRGLAPVPWGSNTSRAWLIARGQPIGSAAVRVGGAHQPMVRGTDVRLARAGVQAEYLVGFLRRHVARPAGRWRCRAARRSLLSARGGRDGPASAARSAGRTWPARRTPAPRDRTAPAAAPG